MCRLLVLDASCWSCWMRLVGLVFVWMRFCFQYSGVSFFEETLGCFLSVCAEERDVSHVCSASLQMYSYDERMFDAPATFPKKER